jgi:hypothetical protein
MAASGAICNSAARSERRLDGDGREEQSIWTES